MTNRHYDNCSDHAQRTRRQVAYLFAHLLPFERGWVRSEYRHLRFFTTRNIAKGSIVRLVTIGRSLDLNAADDR